MRSGGRIRSSHGSLHCSSSLAFGRQRSDSDICQLTCTMLLSPFLSSSMHMMDAVGIHHGASPAATHQQCIEWGGMVTLALCGTA